MYNELTNINLENPNINNANINGAFITNISSLNISNNTIITIDGINFLGSDLKELFELKDIFKKQYPQLFI
jgi:uncharacterized protein YjbI with pentapeptide repeats